MILAAGRGTRLGSLGITTPKVLVDIGGEPLLARHLRNLSDQGLRRVVINTYHLADAIAGFLRTYHGPAEVEVVRERSLLGTAGGVRNALARLRTSSFVVLYGDVLIDSPLDGLLATHSDSDAQATLAVYSSSESQGKGIVELASDGSVRSFVEKGEKTAGAAALINAGAYVLKRSFVREMTSEGSEADFGHDVFPAALATGRKLVGHVLEEPVVDVGTPHGLQLARARVRKTR